MIRYISLIAYLNGFLLLIIMVSAFGVGGSNFAISVSSKAIFYGCCLLFFLVYVFSANQALYLRVPAYFPILGFLLFWAYFRADGYYGFALASQIALVMVFIAPCLGLSESNKLSIFFAFKTATIIFLFFSCLHLIGFGFFGNNNFWGLYCLIFAVMSYAFFKGLTRVFLVTLLLVFLLLSGTRSAMLGFISGLCLISFVQAGRRVKLLLLCAAFLFVGFFYLLGFFDYLFSSEFSALVATHTGKRLESGRLQIWEQIFYGMDAQDWLVGLGGGYDLSELIGLQLSAHSGYVHVLSSYGLVGLSLFVSSIICVFYYNYINRYYISLFLVCALTVREVFETSLINNNFPVAVLFWGIFASGIIDRVANDSVLTKV